MFVVAPAGGVAEFSASAQAVSSERARSHVKSTPAAATPLCLTRRAAPTTTGPQLKKYSQAQYRTAASLAALNFGQQAIFAAGLSALMLLTARDIAAGGGAIGAATVGDLVLVNGLLFQASERRRPFLPSG